MIRATHAVYLASAAVHVVLGGVIGSTPRPRVREPVTVTMREVRRPRAPPPPPPPPAPVANAAPLAAPSPAARPAHHAHARAAAPTAAPAPATTSSSAPDFGIAMGGEVGAPVAAGTPGGGGGGGDASATRHSAHTQEADDCADEATRPRVLEMPEPEYPEAARDEGVEGRVRVELHLDDHGRVIEARVLAGLGHGLDEAALAAARQARFEPATRCGHPVATTFTVGVRFAL